LPRSVQIRYETNRLAFTHLRDAYEQLAWKSHKGVEKGRFVWHNEFIENTLVPNRSGLLL
jgi:hypothetical protein